MSATRVVRMLGGLHIPLFSLVARDAGMAVVVRRDTQYINDEGAGL